MTRRLTPSGEIRTRRSASPAASAAATGTPTATRAIWDHCSDRSAGKNGLPLKGTAASAGRPRKKRPIPPTTPTAAAMHPSAAATTEICRGVAPTRRMAAKRCSRRAAASRVAVAMKISTGNNKAPATTARMNSSLDWWDGPASGAVSKLRTCAAPCMFARSSTVWPITMVSDFGEARADGPIVPTWCPG